MKEHQGSNKEIFSACRPGPRFTKNLKSDRNRKPISGAKMRFTKSHKLMITSIFERKKTLRVARCSRNYSLLA